MQKALGKRWLGRIGRASHTGLIGEKPSLDTNDNCASCHTACHSLEIKSAFENHCEDSGELSDMKEHSHKADQDIDCSHNRDDYRGNEADPVHAAPYDCRSGDSQDDPQDRAI